MDQLLDKSDILIIQETHATEHDINIFFHKRLHRFHVHVAACQAVCNHIIVDGRAVRTYVYNSEYGFSLYTIHNYGYTAGDIETVTDAINTDYHLMKDSPDKMFSLFAGDFNFTAEGEKRLLSHSPATNEANPSTIRRQWQHACNSAIEVVQDAATHFCSATWSFSRIDRFFVLAPPWIFPSL